MQFKDKKGKDIKVYDRLKSPSGILHLAIQDKDLGLVLLNLTTLTIERIYTPVAYNMEVVSA